MSRYKITLNGVESLANSQGYSIFDNINLPEGIDKDILVPTIFERSNEFEVLYADPNYLHFATINFFKRYSETILRWLQIVESEYDPIENYDRHETYTGSDSGSGSGSSSNTSTEKKAAFNSSSFENYEQSSDSGDSESSYSNNDSHTSHIHGNIGVTTAVAMLKEHASFWTNFNIYTAIAELYITEYCILIY